jgi:hypothetical protein
MPGSLVFHGYPTSTASQGVGGAARVETSSLNAGSGSETNFFVWLGIIGIVVPLLLIGGLQFGGFQFVFRR